AALLEIDDNRAIATALAVGPVVDANHAWRWSLSGLVVANTAQHGLTAPRQPLPRELAGTRRPTQHEPRVTRGLACPGGGVGIRAGHRRHPLGEGLPRTRGGVTKKAPHLEREADRERRPGQIGQRTAVTAMNAGGRLRTGGTGGCRGCDLPVQGKHGQDIRYTSAEITGSYPVCTSSKSHNCCSAI